MITSLLWCYSYSTNSIWPNILSAKYNCQNTNTNNYLYTLHKNSNASYTWKSMIKVAQYCRDGTGWNIAHGTRISLWHDRWIDNNLSLRHLIQGPIPRNKLNKSVASIITNASWDLSTLSFILPLQFTL